MDTTHTWHARRLLAGLLAAGALATVPARAAAPAPNVIRAIDVTERGDAVELDIRGTRAPAYTVFKLQDPPRLVVDLASADVSGVANHLTVSRGAVREITTAQYKDDKSAVGRVVIVLDGQPRYEVAARGESVLVTLHPGTPAEAEAKAPAAPPAPAPLAVHAPPAPAPTP